MCLALTMCRRVYSMSVLTLLNSEGGESRLFKFRNFNNMKYLLIILLLVGGAATAQTTYNIRADTTKLEKVGGNNDLVLKNSTRSRTGAYLKNISNGITGFFYAIDSAWMSTDSTLVVRRGDGNDTLLIRGSGISTTPGLQDVITQDPVLNIGGNNNININSGTLTFSDGLGLVIDNTVVRIDESNGEFFEFYTAGFGALVSNLTFNDDLNALAITAQFSVGGFRIFLDDYESFYSQGDSVLHVGNDQEWLNLRTGIEHGFAGGSRLMIDTLLSGAPTDSVMTYEFGTKKVRMRNMASITGVNIYNSDGTLTGNRMVSLSTRVLEFDRGGTTQFVLGTTSTQLLSPDGSKHLVFANGAGGVSFNIGSDATGDIYYKNSSALLTRLPIGSTGDVLTVASGIPSWATPSAGGGTPAGNFGNLQINRNGAFATPGSDSLDFESATGLTVKGNITSSTLTANRVVYAGTAGLLSTSANLTYDNANMVITAAGGVGTGLTITSTNAASYASANFITPTGGNGFQIGKYGASGTVPNGVFFYNPDNSPITFTTNNNRIMDVTGAGNLLLGGTTDPASAYYTIGLHNGGAPTGSLTNGVIIYSEDVAASAELKVRDEAGNITVLSPHNFTGIPMGKSEDMAWSYYSERDGKYITVDMLKAIRTIEKLTVRVAELEKRLGVEPTKPTKLVYKGKVKVKQPVPINKNK